MLRPWWQVTNKKSSRTTSRAARRQRCQPEGACEIQRVGKEEITVELAAATVADWEAAVSAFARAQGVQSSLEPTTPVDDPQIRLLAPLLGETDGGDADLAAFLRRWK